jgi:hypothetical protein
METAPPKIQLAYEKMPIAETNYKKNKISCRSF